jgi:proteasome lid subunit RPN8/RPN11
MIVTITSAVRQALLTHAAETGANECCGLLVGRPGRIDIAIPTRNLSRQPATSFEIDPAVLLHAHRDARSAGRQVIGHYHSHPNGSPMPSPRDAARAVENRQLWLIIAGGGISAWIVKPGDTGALHGRFVAVDLALRQDLLAPKPASETEGSTGGTPA